MKKTLFTLVILIFFSHAVLSQNTQPELPNVIPQNPEAAAFGKYIDTPVGTETGVPNISVPLVELKGKNLNIPVSLSYHSGGIRVSEIASRVGLGWNLNAGGLVSRSVRGVPDDYVSGYLNPIVTVNQFLSASSTQQNNYLINYGTDNDYESDIYSFNFLGQSGKFFFKQNGEVVMVHKSDVRIVPRFVGNVIKGWVITDANGTSYYFGRSKDNQTEVVETTTTHSLVNGSWPQPSTAMTNYINNWQLIEVETLDKEKVTYTYASPSAIEYYNLGGQEKEINVGNGTSNNPNRLIYTLSQDYVRKISSISNSLGRVDFIYDTSQRQDLDFDHRLKEVKLYDNHNSLIDNYQLTHSYFISTQHHGGGPGDMDQRRKRLYLQNVKQIKNSTTNKQWSFEYNTQYILPDRVSFAQDFWGYYNGKSNSYFYPTIKWLVGSNGVYSTIPGADRKVNENYAKACSLKKITYPTGGSTEFVVESNRVNNLPFFGTTDMSNQYVDGLSSVGQGDGIYEKVVTINNLDNYAGGISWFANLTTNCTNPNGFDCPKAELFKYENSQYVLIAATNGQDLQQDIVTTGNSIQLKIKISDFSDSFGGGGFGGGGTPNDVVVSISGFGLPPDTENGSYTGGLRVKKIITKDHTNSVILEKDYLYTQFTSPTKSSGKALNPPTNVHESVPFCNNSFLLGYSDILKSNSIFPLTSGSAYTTFYTNVTELFDDGNEGKTEYTHNFVYDGQEVQTNIFSEGVNTPAHDFSHRRGLLTLKKIYAKEGGQYKVKEETNTTYSSAGGNSLENNIALALSSCYNYHSTYSNLSERYYKTQEVKKVYDGSNYVSNTTLYKYDSNYDGRSFPTETETTTSENNIKIITKTWFPDDVSSTSSLGFDLLTTSEKNAIFRLKKGDLHQVAAAVQIESMAKNGSTVLSRTVQRTNFSDLGNDIVLPKELQKLKGTYNASTNKLEDRIVHHSYYSGTGNIREVSKKDGAKTVYIWGYNESLPIAMIENATYSEVSSQIANLKTRSNNDNDNCLDSGSCDEKVLRVHLNNLRNTPALSDAFVTTFTYDPEVGVTSVTDPMGQTVYYHYDQFNRLEYIIDKDGKVVSKNQYNYKN